MARPDVNEPKYIRAGNADTSAPNHKVMFALVKSSWLRRGVLYIGQPQITTHFPPAILVQVTQLRPSVFARVAQHTLTDDACESHKVVHVFQRIDRFSDHDAGVVLTDRRKLGDLFRQCWM